MFKDKCEAQGKEAGNDPREVEAAALQRIDHAKNTRYNDIVERLSKPDQVLEEVIEWRRSNNLYV
jgi:hypothetical protein